MTTKRVPQRKAKNREAFLRALAVGATVAAAAQSSGISRRTAYDWRNADAAFKAEWQDAYAMGTGVLVAEAFRRAVHGVPKPILHQGRPVRDEAGRPLHVIEYSDTLLMFLLKAREPETYCDRVRARSIERRWAKLDGKAVAEPYVIDQADAELA